MNWPIPYINISWECIIRPRHMRGMQRCCLVLPDITWSVCVSTSNKHEPCRNGSTDWDAVWSCGPRNSVLGGGLNPPGKGRLIFGVPLQCSLSSEFFGHLLSLNSCTFQHFCLFWMWQRNFHRWKRKCRHLWWMPICTLCKKLWRRVYQLIPAMLLTKLASLVLLWTGLTEKQVSIMLRMCIFCCFHFVGIEMCCCGGV